MNRVPVFTAPKYTLKPRIIAEVPFFDFIPTLTMRTLLSSRINFPFVVRSIAIDFANNHANYVPHFVLLSHNMSVSTTGVPPDTNAFTGLSDVSYAVGDNREKRYYPNIEWRDPPSYIKLFINNMNAYPVFVNTIVTIEQLD